MINNMYDDVGTSYKQHFKVILREYNLFEEYFEIHLVKHGKRKKLVLLKYPNCWSKQQLW